VHGSYMRQHVPRKSRYGSEGSCRRRRRSMQATWASNLPAIPLRTKAISRPPLPPFTAEKAEQKARLAVDSWNSRDPALVALAYTPESRWRNRAEFITGPEESQAFLTRKWQLEEEYRLIKEVWAFTDTRIAVRFAYEYRDDSGNWFRAQGSENWQFDAGGLMDQRHARPCGRI